MLIPSNYKSPLFLKNGHVETILPHLFRRTQRPPFKRQQLDLADGDFLHLDWWQQSHKKLMIVSHGLEGSSDSKYIHSLASVASSQGYDFLAWNCRGCSGVPNALKRSYHSGVSDDLRAVVTEVLRQDQYQSIYLVGFSMGGNITMKYLGEESERVAGEIRAAVAVSSPLSLGDCAASLAKNTMGRI